MLLKNIFKNAALLLSIVTCAHGHAHGHVDAEKICGDFKKALNKKGFSKYNEELICYESENGEGVYFAIDGRTEMMGAVEYLLSYGKNSITELFIKFGHLSEKAHENIGKITNLKSLRFIECEYHEIPKQIKYLKNLETLEFRYGYIKKIPSFIFELRNLKSLNISMNELTIIPENLSKLKKLETLELFSNKISGEIPKSLNNLTHLKTFGISGNKNIKGKILTNKSLEECYYDEDAKLCKPKEVKCAKEYKFKSCRI